ncbi:hypothetical protein LTR70_006545 [Exophiala xenobiotica]|uniref:DNA polymerase epsilon subunit D n=1 Tax=Lithohypha guttulata TaxID=1690604 RepID=A0ABR0K7N7_9EURO|nr:hypothetical protein LTR24_006013 [Lithohypha guttulata]KAK5315903.1 hypothetical protein LTR70_006545 [Exophiala xenobiotica]
MPRKSTASAAPTDTNGDVSMVSEAPTPTVSSPNHIQDQPQPEKQEKLGKRKSEGDVVALDDLLLPKSIIQRISKGVLPANTSISKDAVLALTKSATVFISHLAGEANDLTDRKTIQSQDVIKALKEIEMENVMGLGVLGKDGRKGGRVEREVEKWEGDVRGKRRGYREKVKARESGTGVGDTTVGTIDTQGEEEDREHENKRVRIDEDEARDGSAGPITDGTNRLKLNVGRRKSDERENEDVEEAADVVEEDESEQEEENEDAEEQDETQEAEESIDMGADSKQKIGTLAPNGRVEMGGSDDESD